jgi:hypothetical protein
MYELFFHADAGQVFSLSGECFLIFPSLRKLISGREEGMFPQNGQPQLFLENEHPANCFHKMDSPNCFWKMNTPPTVSTKWTAPTVSGKMNSPPTVSTKWSSSTAFTGGGGEGGTSFNMLRHFVPNFTTSLLFRRKLFTFYKVKGTEKLVQDVKVLADGLS